MRTARSAQILLALSTALLALTGCNRQNHSLQIGQQIDLEIFRNTQASPAASSPSTTGVLANTSSQVGVRSWAQSEILVPNDGVYHRPLYKTEYSRVKFTARNRGDFPTAETCLDLQDPRATWEQIGETFVFTPSVVAYDAVTAPFRMAIHPATQSNVKVSPRLPRPGYQRTLPAAGSAGQEVSATADSAATAPASTNATPPASTEPLAPIKVEPTK